MNTPAYHVLPHRNSWHVKRLYQDNLNWMPRRMVDLGCIDMRLRWYKCGGLRSRAASHNRQGLDAKTLSRASFSESLFAYVTT